MSDENVSLTKKVLFSIVLLILAYTSYVFMRHLGSSDPELTTLLEKSGAVKTYSMNVDTVALFPNSTLSISGTYVIDWPQRSFSSLSTTIVSNPRTRVAEREFKLTNIVIKDDMYVQIHTDSISLSRNLPSVSDWHHFSTKSIPPAFTNIAVPGPVLDNMSLLSKNGLFIRLIGKKQAVTFNGTSTTQFTFTPSGTKPDTVSTVTELLNLIGTGTIDIWATPDGTVQGMHFENSKYRSTTTITSFTPPSITAPL